MLMFQRPNFYFIFSVLEEPKPYDIVAADPGYISYLVAFLANIPFWDVGGDETPSDLGFYFWHLKSVVILQCDLFGCSTDLLRWCSLSGMLGLTTFAVEEEVRGFRSRWLVVRRRVLFMCRSRITTHIICLTNDKFINKKKKTPSLRKSKAKPKEMAKNINSVSITVLLFVLLAASTGNFKEKILYCNFFPTLMNMSTCRNPQERGSNILLR
ncbi:LOW QUALITY PROTEIN: hypothetical protein HID58_043169, partial [Brassica napus]